MSNKVTGDEYDEKDLRTHVFDSPDTYAGSDEKSPDKLPIMKGNEIHFCNIEVIPVIYKMFDEIIVNSRDQGERLKDQEDSIPVTEIKVDIDSNTGLISIYNNGDSIKVNKHSSGIYNAELIFGRLLTSGN